MEDVPYYNQTPHLLSDYQTKDALKALEITNNLPIKAKHFLDNNLLDARGIIGVAERANYIDRIRELSKGSGKLWLESQ